MVWISAAAGRSNASAHEVASVATASLDDLNDLLPPDVSEHFIGGFREAVVHVWRGA